MRLWNLLFCLLCLAGPADRAPAAARVHHIPATKLMDCAVYLPEDFDPARPYPLVIGLHGYGGSPHNMAGLWDYYPEHPFILALPEAPYAYAENGVKSGTMFSWDFKGPAPELWPQADPWVYRYVLQVARELRAAYPVSRVILLGHSQGVAYAYAAAFHDQDELVDGLICFAGTLPDPERFPWLLDQEVLASRPGLPVFVAHGRNDRVVAMERSRRAADRLRGAGCRVEFHHFEGGHTVPPGALEKALRWHGVAMD